MTAAARGSRPTGAAAYGSDLIVDLLHRYGIGLAAMNPGASFRGLHDSIVNYGGNRPMLIECPHEKIAVSLAHGYAKASGTPMAAILHDTVGLLHGAMGIFYAYLDRAPLLVLGGTGPMAAEKRRPRIDWIHTAALQGNAVREYVKWDDQPFSVASFPESFARGYRAAIMQPQGPVYLCYDAALQEEPLVGEVAIPDPATMMPTRLHADPGALDEVAGLLAKAERPLLLADFLGRDPEGMGLLMELAEAASAGVLDLGSRLNVPSLHPLNQYGTAALEQADLVVALDVPHLDYAVNRLDRSSRADSASRIVSRLRPDCRIVEIGFGDLRLNSWSQDFGRLLPTALSILGDPIAALPTLTERTRERIGAAGNASAYEARHGALGRAHVAARSGWQAQAREQWDASPISTARLASEIWEVIKARDWVLTANTLGDWTRRLWDFDRPYRHPGRQLGTATQIGMSLGVAFAHKDAGRLVVDIQPDGDLMFDVGALWVASYYALPMLVVMYNNRAYYNDWEHQERVARHRGRDERMAYLGMEIDKPAPDFAAIARGFGWYAEGPFSTPEGVGAAIRRAADYVERERLPALVDIVTQYR